MRKINYFLLLVYFLLLLNGCKSIINNHTKSEVNPTLESKITPFEFIKTDSDSILAKRFLDYKINQSKIDSSGYDYTGAEIFYQKDSTFKIINLYGEYIGATLNPTSESYIVQNDKILDKSIYGETFRIDKTTKNSYLLYIDNFDRFASSFEFYEISFLNDSVKIEKTKNHKNFVYELINKHKQVPNDFPKNINNLFPVNPNLPHNDTTSTEFDGNYYPEEEFMTRNSREVLVQVFYRKKYGDEIEKVLQINKNDTISEISLAMIGGDSNWYSLSSEFVDDSIFTQTIVNRETTIDQTNLMGYSYDSIIKKFRYNEKFELDTISKDTFKYEKRYFKRYNNPVENHIFIANHLK